MNALARQQDALLALLWRPGHQEALHAAQHVLAGDFARGLLAYRSNAHMLAQRALGAAFPVTRQLLGDENFAPLARDLWRHAPPARGDIAQWGAAFPRRLHELLHEHEPWLPDLASVEWALHRAATAADGEPDHGSLARLADVEPASLRLRLAPGTTCVTSRWPVVTVIEAHGPHGSLEDARLALGAPQAQSAVVWREGLRPMVRQALEGEAAFITAVQAGRCLAAALDAAPELEFETWLLPAVRSRLLLGVDYLKEPTA